MSECNQTDTQTILEHGKSVWEYTKRIISGDFDGLRLPDWFVSNHRYIVNNLHDIEIIKNYNIFHDCGKPFCLEYGIEGNRHFPNHENVSKQIYSSVSNCKTTSDLIGYDMAIHKDTADKINSYNWDIKTSFTLMVTAFAEIHSNAEMFGGIESKSFKIKYKKIVKRAKMLFNKFKEDDDHIYSYVIVRKDMIDSHRSVQGTHAAIEFFKNNKYNYHPSVIYVLVKNENKLKKVHKQLLEIGINCSIFRENMKPYDNEVTAICTEPIDGKKRDFMRKFQLM